jgi:DNA-binding NarL/FixJ family response regulator
LKDVSSEGLADAIRKVHQGQALLPPNIASKVVTEFSRLAEREHRRREQPLIEPLNARELEVLELVAEGLSNREIGAWLFITEGTVKNHISNILTKLGVRDRTQAVQRAQGLGLL